MRKIFSNFVCFSESQNFKVENVNAGVRWSKNSQKLVNVVCERPPKMHILTSFFARSLSFNWIWSKEKKMRFSLALVLATQTPIKKRVSFFSFFYVHTSSYSLLLMTSYSLMCILLAALSIIALFFSLRIFFAFSFIVQAWL